jgi:hypothetical protein
MARATERWVEDPWYAPQTFRGVGAHKNFRDLVYRHKGIMSADHRYYRSHRMYDYPHKDIAMRLFNAALRLFNAALLLFRRIPFLCKRVSREIRVGHVRAHRRLVEAHKPRVLSEPMK